MDYKTLCAELVTAVDEASDTVDWISDCVNAANHPELWAQCVDLIRRQDDLIARARAALAAEPEGPSDDELLKLTENISTEYLCKHKSLPSDWDPGDYASSTKGLIEFARAVLARWGNQS